MRIPLVYLCWIGKSFFAGTHAGPARRHHQHAAHLLCVLAEGWRTPGNLLSATIATLEGLSAPKDHASFVAKCFDQPAADHGQRQGLKQKLRKDVAPLGPDGSAHADF